MEKGKVVCYNEQYMKKTPLVSVLVHTKNSERTVRKHLKSIKEQNYKDIEIIMVDNNSTDNTIPIARSIADNRVFLTSNIYNFGPERSAQRNFAAKKAHGDYFLVPDSDMILGKKIVAECVDLVLGDSKIKAVVIPEENISQGFWSKCKALERECYAGDDTIEAARFFERRAFWEMGGYDESITGPEDWDLPQMIKSKYKLGRIKCAIIHDEREVSLLLLARKKHYYGLKVSKYIKKHPIRSTAQQLVYLLRPAFYRHWRLLTKHPILSMGMIAMLTVEQIAGFVGFIQGVIKHEAD